MKPIGGYFGLECSNSLLYHDNGVYLNLCRSGFKYLIRTLGIKKMYVPYFTCHVVVDSILEEGCVVESYHLDSGLMPDRGFHKSDYIIYNNYFGVLGKNVRELSLLYPNLIVDNAQAFFPKLCCRAAIYSPRKFFGLPDGGILVGKDIPKLDLEEGQSKEFCSHLLTRLDSCAEDGYEEFVMNERKLEELPLQNMSKLTKSLMRNIDYENAKARRLSNFEYLRKALHSEFPFALAEDDVPMVYPYLVENGESLRKKLISKQIYVAKYWPNVQEWCGPAEWEYKLTEMIVPLPIDQRYGEEDMDRILEIIQK